MANDAIVLSLENLEFTWHTARTMHGYLVGVATDNFGATQVVQQPASTFIKHRPLLRRPFSWPLAFAGFTLYQRTGGLPDFVSFSLMIVRDRSLARRAGAALQDLGDSDDLKRALGKAAALAATAGGAATLAASAGGQLVKSLVDMIGGRLALVKDKLLDTIDGTIVLDPAARSKSEIASTVKGAVADATFDLHLFDAATDTASKEAVELSLADLQTRGLLIASSPAPTPSAAP